MSEPLVVTVVLNTNRREDTLECIASLRGNTYQNSAIIVLDNQSSDGSVQAIRAEYPEVQIIELEHNLGYAGNNNVGIAAAVEQGADWVFVLNEDTILAPDCLEYLVKAGEGDPGIGIVGPLVYHHHAPNMIQTAGGLLGSKWECIHLGVDEPDQGQYTDLHQVEWISGCGILVRREAIEQAGMLDERYFYYHEELEWCMRIGFDGWKVLHEPNAKMWHKGVTMDHRPKPSVTYYATRNRLLTLAKHKAPPTAWAYAWTQLLRTLTSWSIKPRWRYMREHRNAMWRGMLDFLQRRWGKMPTSD